MNINPSTTLIAGGYLLGSIPFGLLIGLSRGVDIRKHGSGNIGATNLGRIVGRKWGYLGFLLDVAKGLLPVLYAGSYLRRTNAMSPEGLPGLSYDAQLIWLAVGAACIIGHMFPVYLRFRGGKGVATSLGVVLGVYPFFTLTAVFAFAIWLAVWAAFRYISLASIIAAIGFPIGFLLMIWRIDAWQLGPLWPLFTFACLMGSLIIIRHRHNIARLLAGTENRTGGLRAGREDSLDKAGPSTDNNG